MDDDDRDDFEKAIERERERTKEVPERAILVPAGVSAQELKTGILGPVSLDGREGVYVHSFKCMLCALHFSLFSWEPNRHTSATVTCPECRQNDGHFLHWRATVNERKDFQYSPGKLVRFDQVQEIYHAHPWPQSVFLDDSGSLAK